MNVESRPVFLSTCSTGVWEELHYRTGQIYAGVIVSE